MDRDLLLGEASGGHDNYMGCLHEWAVRLSFLVALGSDGAAEHSTSCGNSFSVQASDGYASNHAVGASGALEEEIKCSCPFDEQTPTV